ncbi:phage major tail tube protein [Pannonibacter sp. P2PFMT1]|uniref:phage major tail tube protein n=1 Tax=Pannonibacter sp. P2PFMT1 TaxID=2003582 RepID=UPI00164695ED|nr:phage major tail tube protein [Pannonibacter sp. P2PFMT1]
MATSLPSWLLRDCTAFVDGVNKIGQIGDVTIPVPAVKVEELRNGGMVRPREIHLGYEKMDMSLKLPGMDPQVWKLFGLKPGTEKQILVTGALVSEDGSTVNASLTVRGFVKSANGGNWKPGQTGENDHGFAVNYYKLEIAGEEILAVDDFDVVVGGESQMSDIRQALLLN